MGTRITAVRMGRDAEGLCYRYWIINSLITQKLSRTFPQILSGPHEVGICGYVCYLFKIKGIC